MTRLFVDLALEPDSDIDLPPAAAHHARTVLRLRRDDEIRVFNGDGRELSATLTRVSRERVTARIGGMLDSCTESPLAIELVQAVSRGERMDYTLQKVVELGVTRIVPVISERTVVRLDSARAAKRLAHWRGVVQHAAEQSGRLVLPALADIVSLGDWVSARAAAGDGLDACSVLHPRGGVAFAALPARTRFTLLAGPEGGYSEREIETLVQAGVTPVRLGPRVLRTETAAVAALAVAQALWGDLG